MTCDSPPASASLSRVGWLRGSLSWVGRDGSRANTSWTKHHPGQVPEILPNESSVCPAPTINPKSRPNAKLWNPGPTALFGFNDQRTNPAGTTAVVVVALYLARVHGSLMWFSKSGENGVFLRSQPRPVGTGHGKAKFRVDQLACGYLVLHRR